MDPTNAPAKAVAIVGAGPGALAAARFLLAHRFEPVLFEQSSRLGGQWNQGARHSGVWPEMFTNTSRVLTRFSDLDWPPGTKMFTRNQEALAYLELYADKFGIRERIRLRHRVELIEGTGDGRWAITFKAADGTVATEIYRRVIVASGRYHDAQAPQISGLESFSGTGGVNHTFYFRDAKRYAGQRVLVAGGAISAVEIAPELAFAGAASVFSCMRRQRYVLQRIVAGVPIDFLVFTRFAALAKERLPLQFTRNRFKEFILRSSGPPQRWGALPANDDPLLAGFTQNQFYLPLVADGRIISKPWIRSVAGQRVTFEDGSSEEVDAILFATGFRLHLPFLSPPIRDLVGAEGPSLRLYHHTFHPQLPGLAFLGLFHQGGPKWPPLELQARWITYVWSGGCSAPHQRAMAKEIATLQPSEAALRMDDRCIDFARHAGVEPDPERWPLLKRALLFGPLSPICFRLSGPDALPDAADRFAADAAEFGCITSPELTPAEQAQLRMLEQAKAAGA
jgi:thioredoxin reductase